MGDPVSNLIDRRREDAGRSALGKSLTLAFAAHLLGLTAAILLPRLGRVPEEPPTYVAVQIVSAERLGVARPRPAPPPRPDDPKPEPVPEAKPATPAPVLPDPERKEPAAQLRTPAEAKPDPAASADQPREVEGSASGSPSGLSLGAAVAAFDNPSFTYGYYVDQMLAKISSNWVRPPVGSGVEATLYFRIQRDGSIRELSIARSSGINGFDLAALRAIQSSSPLPPLPRAFREDSLGVNLIVR